jgi:predicted RNase H-like HicB family nuclease
MNKYLVVFERADSNYSAFSPDLSGCVATGKHCKEVEKNIKEAIALHKKGMREDGIPVPQSTSFTEYVEV